MTNTGSPYRESSYIPPKPPSTLERLMSIVGRLWYYMVDLLKRFGANCNNLDHWLWPTTRIIMALGSITMFVVVLVYFGDKSRGRELNQISRILGQPRSTFACDGSVELIGNTYHKCTVLRSPNTIETIYCSIEGRRCIPTLPR